MSFEGGDELGPGGFKALGRRDVRRDGGPQCLLKLLIPFTKRQQKGFSKQRVFGREVVANGGQIDPGRRCYVASGGGVVAFFQQTFLGCRQESVTIAHKKSLEHG